MSIVNDHTVTVASQNCSTNLLCYDELEECVSVEQDEIYI